MQGLSYTYDSNNWLTKITASVKTGSITKETTLRDYTYDSLGRLTKSITTNHLENDSKKTNTYTYDGVGNRLSEDENGTKTTYTYNGLDQVKTATVEKGTTVDEVKTYNYDLNRNEVSQALNTSFVQRTNVSEKAVPETQRKLCLSA